MTVSAEIRGAMFAEETDDGLIALLTISHADLTAPIRVAANKVDVPSRGETFTAFPFDIQLPSAEPDSPPSARLVIDNVSREIGTAVRSISSAADILIEVVRLKDLESVELAFPSLKLRNVRFDAGQVTGDILSEDLQIEPYPGFNFVPGRFPGLF